MPQFIGEDLLARDENGRLCARIATVFPRGGTIVTLPGIHATQRMAYAQSLSEQRASAGLEPLGEEQLEAESLRGVDLVIEEDTVLIRPDPNEMALAFEADELLQEILPKEKIKFLHVLDAKVRDAIKRRGECWRINALPRSPEQMRQMIEASKIAIGGRDIYYYNNATGTRFLTYQAFHELASLPEAELRQHLIEICNHANRLNRHGRLEVAFFMAEASALPADFAARDFAAMAAPELSAAHGELERKFHAALRPEFRRDDPICPIWRSRMFAALIGQNDKAVSEESLLGLSAEFFMQVEWLPGGRIEDGELLLDPLFGDGACAGQAAGHPLCDDKARGFIFNFIRDYGDLEYVNIGRVTGSLSIRGEWPGRRGVYLAEVKQRTNPRPILRVIRMQKWGVSEHLDEGKDLLRSILESEQYTDYILDRRLGCRQLGMNLPPRVSARKLGERYSGKNPNFRGLAIRSAYFERDYVAGLATDKVPAARFAEEGFAVAFAHHLGRAAAPNLIVGRCDLQGNIIFDDGDELVIENELGIPIDIVVADPTGTFAHYLRPLSELAAQYAGPIRRRLPYLPDPDSFASAYVSAFVERFTHIQRDYARRQRAFDTLFKHLPRDESGNFRYRWDCVLARLQGANAQSLADQIREALPKLNH